MDDRQWMHHLLAERSSGSIGVAQRVRLYVAVILLVGAVPATGLVAVSTLSTQETPQTGTVGQNASDRLVSMDGFNATVKQTYAAPTPKRNYTGTLSARPGTGMFRTVGSRATLTVSNGSALWRYDRRNNTATVFPMDATDPRYVRQGERIERLFARLNVSRASVDERKQVSLGAPVTRAPVDSPRQQPRQQPTTTRANSSTGNVTLVYNGTATVDGRETYLLEVGTAPGQGATGKFSNFTRRMYIDTEWFLPLRTELSYGDRFRTTRVLSNVTVNPGLDDSLFTFTPPENATVNSVLSTTDRVVYRDRPALAANTTVPVPEPDLPDSFSFDSARLTAGETRLLRLDYVNDTAALSVSVAPVKNRSNLRPVNDTDRGADSTLTINGQNATYSRSTTSRIVQWSCPEYRYTVVGQGVPRELTIQVAESVECGG